MNNPFTSHPRSIGESYLQHLIYAISTALSLSLTCGILVIHGLLPFLFTRTVSNRLYKVVDEMEERAHIGRFGDSV